MKFLLSAICAIFVGSAAFAQCPDRAPKTFNNYLSGGDQKVNAAWLQKNLSGRKVVYSGKDVETYSANGGYSDKRDGQSWKANAYKFYNNGVRCIGYDQPRFDLYVVNNGQLVLINEQKQRYIGQIRK